MKVKKKKDRMYSQSNNGGKNMAKKNEGKLKKLSEIIFKRITKNKAKERINDEFKSYISKEEKQIGEKLSKEEIRELRKEFFETRGRKIIEEEARKARRKATVLALVGALGIGGVGGYTLGTRDAKILGITEGEKGRVEINMDEVKEDVNISNEKENRDKHSIFVDGIKYSPSESDTKDTDEPTPEEKIAEEIKGLDSAEEIDAYLANMYIEAYEQQTGDEKLNTSDIRISQNSESYVYVLDDGQIVSHGDLSYETEKQIEADGKSHDEVRRDVKIYSVELTETGETIDEMTTKLERVIPGENYTNMWNYDSVLVDMGEIIQKAFRLKELLKELESNPGNEYIEGVYENTQEELVESVVEYNKGKTTPTIEENQEKENLGDER